MRYFLLLQALSLLVAVATGDDVPRQLRRAEPVWEQV